MEIVDKLTITDKRGFIRPVIVKHSPTVGISVAYYEGNRIASREYGRMSPPMSDDDSEWEQWEEQFREWCDGVISDLTVACKQHFNDV